MHWFILLVFGILTDVSRDLVGSEHELLQSCLTATQACLRFPIVELYGAGDLLLLISLECEI